MSKLTNAEQKLLDQLDLGAGPEIVTNPYSGRSVELDAQCVALHDFIKGCEIVGDFKQFDLGRQLFSKLNSTAYMILID